MTTEKPIALETETPDNECPLYTGDYTVKPELEKQLAIYAAEPERLQDYRPSTLETETALDMHELNEESVEKYKFRDQEFLSDEKARLVNIISVRELGQKLARISGLHFEFIDHGRPQQLGLFAYIRGEESRQFSATLPKGMQAICFVQAPYMPEWSVLRIDEYGLPVDFKYKGWRDVIVELVRKNACTEAEAHEVFGEPSSGYLSKLYRKNLWNLRNHNSL